VSNTEVGKGALVGSPCVGAVVASTAGDCVPGSAGADVTLGTWVAGASVAVRLGMFVGVAVERKLQAIELKRMTEMTKYTRRIERSCSKMNRYYTRAYLKRTLPVVYAPRDANHLYE